MGIDSVGFFPRTGIVCNNMLVDPLVASNKNQGYGNSKP